MLRAKYIVGKEIDLYQPEGKGRPNIKLFRGEQD
jgi:hypothetical protein